MAPKSAFSALIPVVLSLALFSCSCALEHAAFRVVNASNPVSHFHPLPLVEHLFAQNAKDIVSCERVKVAGVSRLKINKYASSLRVTLVPSTVIPSRLHDKIETCFHSNASMGLCQCAQDEWRILEKGQWNSIMSPYEDKYVDVKFMDGASGSVTISLQEDFQLWRVWFLAFGFILLLLAPVVSQWVPFYYSSSMALGVLLVVLILLFQGMKLLPTGRKSIFYLAMYGSMLGAGSFLIHQFSILVNSILASFGLSQDMYNLVSVFLLVGIFFAGAALGYWIVRKFILSDDGTVDIGVAHFVKWAMRAIAAVFGLLSTLDTILALFALSSCWAISWLITYKMQHLSAMKRSHMANKKLWQQRAGQASANHKRAEFLRKSQKMRPSKNAWKDQPSPYAWSTPPKKDLILSPRGALLPHTTNAVTDDEDYYSSFHKTPNRRRFSKREWEEFTEQSTRKALQEWAASPEYTDWLVEHVDRIRLDPYESSDEDSGSESGTLEGTAEEVESGISLFKWY